MLESPRNSRPGARTAPWMLVVVCLLAPLRLSGAQEATSDPAPSAAPTFEEASLAVELIGSAAGSGAGSGAALDEVPDGSGATDEGSGDDAPRAAPAPMPERLGEWVVERARALAPPLNDSRAEQLRVAEPTSPEAAQLLGMSIGDLASREPVQARLAEALLQLAEAEAAAAERIAEARAAIQRANELTRASAPADESPAGGVVRRAQRNAAVLYAEQLADERVDARREVMFRRAVVRVLERRLEAIEAAEAVAAEQTDPGSDGVQLAEAIEEGRERLARESEATSAVEARAAEAQERARIEREQARDAAERRLAEQWEELAPALERIVRERRIEEERLAAQTQTAEALAATQVDVGAELGSVLALDDRRAQASRADAFVDRLIDMRRTAREALADAQSERAERRAVLATERQAVAAAEAAVDGVSEQGMSAELRARFRELREEQLRIAEERLALQRLRAETADTRWRLLETEINFYARTIDRLIPMLSQARRDTLLAPTLANFREARQNFVERLVAFRVVWTDRLSGESRMRAHSGSSLWSQIWRPLLVLLLVVMARRTLPQWRDLVVGRVLALRELPQVRRRARYVVKLAEVVYATLPQLIVFAGIIGLRAWMPQRLPEVEFVLAIVFWVVGFRFAARASRTIILPRRDRDPVAVVIDGATQRIGVDLFSFTTRSAQLIQRTIRVCLLYFVVGRVGLATVRALLGPGFFFYYASVLFQVGLWVVIYLLGWYWRADIVQRFCESTKETSAFEEWLKARQDKPYIVLVVAVLALYLVARWVLRVGAEWAAGRGPGQRIANFLFQRRIQRASTAAESAVTSSGPLPVAYQRVFRAAPLTDEAYRVARPAADAAVVEALDAWRADRVRGTIAVVGDPGAGKTTYLNAIEALVGDEAEPVVRVALEERMTSVEALVAWVSSLVEAEASTRAELVAALNDGPERVVVIDHCELLFLRCVGGFAAVDAFFDLVTLTNHRVFWVLSFDRYAWQYLHRVRDRRGYFRSIVMLKPLTAEQLREAVEKRNDAVGVHPQFDRLAGAESAEMLEEVRTSAGYFRLLAEASGGNLRVAQHLWLRSLVKEPDGNIHVHLFQRADDAVLKRLSDDLLFALTAVVQHAGMTNDEVALAINADPLTCEVYVNHLRELGVLEACTGQRVRLAVLYYQATIRRLRLENLLHLDQG